MSARSRAKPWFADMRFALAEKAAIGGGAYAARQDAERTQTPCMSALLDGAGRVSAWSGDGVTWYDERGEIAIA